MIIGIDASRAFLKRRTGIEEYAYQTIKHLRDVIPETDTVVLYVRKKIAIKNGRICIVAPLIDFDVPHHWQIRALFAPRLWTQVRLSIEMLFHTPDILFIPAHTVPLIHPARTIVTIHGLEYEFCKESYSFLDRLYMRLSIRFSCLVAWRIICVSENTRRDVIRLYHIEASKIEVIYEGYETNFQFPISNFQTNPNELISKITKPYLLFIGRLEERKNIVRMIEAFEILKAKYHIPHSLVLVGKPGYGYEEIRFKILDSRFKNDIKELGYVNEEEKWELLRGADVFLFPSLYEGFGIPVLEAQSVGVPVVTSQISSLPEIGGKGALYVFPYDTESIAQGIFTLISESERRNGILQEATKNVHRFHWDMCAKNIYQIMNVQ